MINELPPADLPLATVGRYGRLSQARERGLVVAAMELPHWIVREHAEFVLCVEEHARESVAQELEKFETEARERAATQPEPRPLEKLNPLSLYIAGWIMAAFWLAQNLAPDAWLAAGAAASGKIIREGEWWRTVTALTLHADFAHLMANVASGLLFAAFAVPQFGSGVTWLAIIASGAAGNVLNASFYAHEQHTSIGASTAVFGALGLLVAAEFLARIRSPQTRGRWHLFVPLGAGLGLLAFLGAGDEHSRVDHMAHLWGFIAGLVLGAVVCATRVKDRLSVRAQRALAAAAIVGIGSAWSLAVAR